MQIKITNDPYERPRMGRGKYEDLFDRLAVGQCLVIPEGGSVQSVQSALAKYVKRKRIHAVTKMRTRCADGKARVWLLPAKANLRTVWATPDGKMPKSA